MSYSSQAQFETLTVVASADITTSYVKVATFTHPIVLLAFKSGLNGDVVLGIDGSTAKWGFPPPSGSAYDIQANHPQVSPLMLPANTSIYIKWQGSAPMSPTGNFYIEALGLVN